MELCCEGPDSQAYRKMDVTREHIRRILELREILLSIKTGFSLVNAAVVCAILESISGLEPSSVITEPRYLKLVTVEISAEKTKLMTNNTSGINTEIKVNGQKLETVTRFKYLGSVKTDDGSKPEILSRIAQATAALTRLKPVLIDKSISLSSKIRLMRSLVTSIFLYACESWILTAELQRRIQAMEMRCYRKIL